MYSSRKIALKTVRGGEKNMTHGYKQQKIVAQISIDNGPH